MAWETVVGLDVWRSTGVMGRRWTVGRRLCCGSVGGARGDRKDHKGALIMLWWTSWSCVAGRHGRVSLLDSGVLWSVPRRSCVVGTVMRRVLGDRLRFAVCDA